ncbi:unnamed protein product [Ectocarpus sp. 6 AP-2014]
MQQGHCTRGFLGADTGVLSDSLACKILCCIAPCGRGPLYAGVSLGQEERGYALLTRLLKRLAAVSLDG